MYGRGRPFGKTTIATRPSQLRQINTCAGTQRPLGVDDPAQRFRVVNPFSPILTKQPSTMISS